MATPSPAHASTRRQLYTQLLTGFTDGSEEGFNDGGLLSAARTDTPMGSPAVTELSPDGHVAGTEQSKSSHEIERAAEQRSPAAEYRDVHPDGWTTPQLATFLEDSKVVPEAGVEFVVTSCMVGYEFAEVMGDIEVHTMLADHLSITERMGRLRLMAKWKQAMNQNALNPKGIGFTEGSGCITVVGEKGIKIPSIPKCAPGQEMITATQWQTYMTAVKAWAGLASEDFAWLCKQVYSNPKQNWEAVHRSMNEMDARLDKLWGVSMLSEIQGEMQKMFATADDHDMNGVTSGLRMAAKIAHRVSRICDTRYLSLYNELTDRAPLTDPHKLERELQKITQLVDQLRHQGETVPPVTLYSVLRKITDEMRLMPEMTVVLSIPIENCLKEYGKDGTALLETLKESAWEIRNNPLYKSCRHASLAAGVDNGTERQLPPLHIQQRAGQGCTNERELGECKIPGCPAIHGKEANGWTGNKCTGECYEKYKVCDRYFTCKDKHDRKTREEYLAGKAEATAAGWKF